MLYSFAYVEEKQQKKVLTYYSSDPASTIRKANIWDCIVQIFAYAIRVFEMQISSLIPNSLADNK